MTPVRRTVSLTLSIMLDGDPSGCKASSQLMRNLIDIADVQVVRLPDRCDPDDLSDPLLKQLLNGCYTF
jgi:DNA primase